MITENSSAEAKARYARFWGALPVTQEQRAAQRPRYVQNGYEGLPGYASAQPSKWEARTGESDMAFVSRVKGLLNHLSETLPPAEFERVVTACQAAEQRLEGGVPSHSDLRAHLSSRESGSGYGLFGSASGAAQADMIRRQPMRNSLSESDVPQLGGLAAALGTPGQPSLSLLDRRVREDQPVMRTPIPAGSSGQGWTTSRG